MEPLEKLIQSHNRVHTTGQIIMPSVSGFTAAFRGIPLCEYFQDSRKMAECQIRSWEHFQYDAVHSVIDPLVEAESLGCVVAFPDNDYPYMLDRVFDDGIHINQLQFFDPRETHRTNEILGSVRIMRDWLGNSAMVIGNISGPLTIACQLAGIPQFIEQASSDLSVIARLLRITMQVCIRWGCELFSAGAHIIMIHDNFTPLSILPDNFVSNFLMLHYRNIFKQFRKTGGIVTGCAIPQATTEMIILLSNDNLDLLCSPVKSSYNNLPGQIDDDNVIVDTECFEQCKRGKSPAGLNSSTGSRENDSQLLVFSSNGEIPVDTSPENFAGYIRMLELRRRLEEAA